MMAPKILCLVTVIAALALGAHADRNLSCPMDELQRQLRNQPQQQNEGKPVEDSSMNYTEILGPGEDPGEMYTFNIDAFDGRILAHQVGEVGLLFKYSSGAYSDISLHDYADFTDLKRSSGPECDQAKCVAQLEHLSKRVTKILREQDTTRDVNLWLLIDTFGRLEPGLMLGHTSTVGSYSECLRRPIVDRTNPSVRWKTRFCWASLSVDSRSGIKFSNIWKSGVSPEQVTLLKFGVCLPAACDSLNWGTKYEIVDKFLRYNSPILDNIGVELAGLYCLPDEQSEIRNWMRSPKAVAFVACVGLWLIMIAYCTWKSERGRKSEQQASNEKPECLQRPTNFMLVCRDMSVVNNLKLLFSVDKKSSLLEMDFKQNGDKETLKPQADFNIVESIKVIGMFYMIAGHTMMLSTTTMANGVEIGRVYSPYFTLTNMIPAFAVNVFFSITGIITCYLILWQTKKADFITSPSRWVLFILLRYIRVMPLYLLVFAYTKTVAKYTGSGPFWDYATGHMSRRRMCEQESWLPALTFTSNFKNPLHHCIQSAWYIANDFQFFLVTPFFLVLLHKHPKVGQIALALGIGASFCSGFFDIIYADVTDLKPIANFRLHGFKTYILHLGSNYTYPNNRISSYLCGLLLGFWLYQHECGTSNGKRMSEKAWSRWLVRHSGFLSTLCLIAFAVTPMIAVRIRFSLMSARFAVALLIPSYHVLYALLIGAYIVLASTGNGNKTINRFLSAPAWKPFARLSLCALLVNIEVISYLIDTQQYEWFFSNLLLTSIYLAALISVYVVSIVTCVLFESPVRAIQNRLITTIVPMMIAKERID